MGHFAACASRDETSPGISEMKLLQAQWSGTGQSPRHGSQQQQFQATTLLQPLLSTLSAVEMLHDSALCKCTIDNLTLTLTLT